MNTDVGDDGRLDGLAVVGPAVRARQALGGRGGGRAVIPGVRG